MAATPLDESCEVTTEKTVLNYTILEAGNNDMTDANGRVCRTGRIID